MKTTFLKTGSCFIMASILLAACNKNSSVPTSATASSQLSFGVKADNAVAPLFSTTSTASNTTQASANVNFTSGIANVSGFKLEAKRRGTEIEITSKNLTTVDLFAINPAVIGATIDTGTYSEIELKVEFTKTSAASLVLKGTFTNSSGATIPIEFDLNDNAEVKVEAQNVVVDGKTDLTTFVTLHLNKLLSNVSISDVSAATLTGGTLVISNSSNTTIYNKILSNLSSSGDSNGFEHHNR